MRFITAFLLALLGTTALALAQSSTPAAPQEFQSTETVSYYLAPVEGSGVSGYLQATEEVTGGSKLVVTLQGIEPGSTHALALFEGDCGPDRPFVTELEPVPNIAGDPYASLSESNMPFAAFAEGDYFLYVYEEDSRDSAIVACGEVGVGANASGFAPADSSSGETGGATTSPTSAIRPKGTDSTSDTSPAASSTPAPNEEFRSLRAASYVLSPVEGSGVSANLQVSEQVEGGTRLTLSVSGTDGTGDHAVVLYEGNCGPDRPEVLRLTNVNGSDGDPFSSITDTELSFDAITEGDHFAYLFEAEPGSRILACGEVGAGANP